MKYNYNKIGRIYSIFKYLIHYIFVSNRYKLTKRVKEYIKHDNYNLSIEERNNINKGLNRILINQINYSWIGEYRYRYIEVLFDKNQMLYYVFHNGKKLYFKRGLSKREIRNLYNELCIEMDVRSPHSYHAFKIHYQQNDVALDIGAAEGIWALDIVDKVKELYLFECEDAWIEALNATFAAYDKVHIVNKYISDHLDMNYITLDDYFYTKQIFPTIIKADVEGMEVAVVRGTHGLLLNHHIRHALICTYHNSDDFMEISTMLKNYKYKIESSQGHMITIYSEPNYKCSDISKIFRIGLIHAYKSTLLD